ncbi:phosphinothricin acetyltransferase [Ruminiclostridium sufflavum DSM 19573]|uniref:Phosphinothricin acetyltransferase n=1 Tax=Ruminiclostridium sufflavum DSM 19573 TaxID=1121337 RepID=A0A318XPD3_9FIRM|nr:GNAT family N-acetyltransferase [Ruminiclostridium sufflavum]PYG89018.1 phosphinothricin acetyltransferase [Ruminiclostridium sufflavum DSM 19573]
MRSNIRKAKVSDLSRITEIYNWAVENTTASFDINSQTLEQRAEWFEKHDERHPLIVYEIEGKVAGYASLSEYRSKEAYNITCELSVYVDPEYHKLGIGKELMGEVIELGKNTGFHIIISCICADNDISIKMHEQFGFKLCGHMKEIAFKFDKYLDCLFYQLFV